MKGTFPMRKCKKYKPQASSPHSHHRNPDANCQNCVYFSQMNCGTHAEIEGMGAIS